VWFLEALAGLWHIAVCDPDQVEIDQNVITGIFFLFGLIIGSFLNVCITRIPEGVSIVAPGSRCPRCMTPIKPYDNVPVLGWIWLRGKCRSCGLPISPLYPLIEMLTGLLFIACYASFGLTLATFKWVFFTCLIIVLTITDLRVRLLPDAVNWPGAGAGLLFAALVPPDDGTALWLSERLALVPPPGPILGVLDAIIGAAFGSLLLWGSAALYKAVRGREGMGLGDVKMMAMVGAFLGLRGSFLTILVGTLLGSIVGGALIAALYVAGWKRRVAERANRRGLGSVTPLRWAIASQYQLPLGTFLGIAALLVIHFAPQVLTRLQGWLA
jgi:leader peptidase (prepilin peptidase)/N-methyltransferase